MTEDPGDLLTSPDPHGLGMAGAAPVEALLQRVIFERPDGSFTIAAFVTADGLRTFVAKGPLWGLSAGETVALSGRWEEDPRYGRQLRVSAARPVLPATPAGIQRYLVAAGVRGIGPKLAARIVAAFGERTLEVVAREPARLQQVPGLGAARRAALVAALGPRIARDAALIFLLDLGVGVALAGQILEALGEDAVRTVREHPYRLATEVHGVGFTLADRIARSLGIGEHDPARIDAGVGHALGELAGHGHTAPTAVQVLDAATGLLGCSVEQAQDALARQVARGHIVALRAIVEPVAAGPHLDTILHYGGRRLMRAEANLAADLTRLAANAGHALAAAELPHRLALAAAVLGFSPADQQAAAIAGALSSGLMVVTGGPGTGKTTIIRGVMAASGPDELKILLAAPTGRAARRLADATGHEARTIHRLLEFEPRSATFRRGPELPLEADLVIVDECSMVDTALAAALCRAIRPGARLLLVGDADQLPSVGPGAVLDDLVRSERCDVVRLERIYRQAGRSMIVENAHRICMGRRPISADRANPGDFYLLERHQPEAVIETLLEVILRRLPERYGLDPADDIQVIVPMHRGTLGTVELNQILRDALNPDSAPVGRGLTVGDKVIQIRNNYELDIFNGDIGRIIRRQGDSVLVRLGDREVACGDSALGDLQLAYAITVHKSQGSEYPAVVLPLHMQHRMLLQRNLLYTAVTRARRFVAVIGQGAAIGHAVANASPMRRATLLRRRLRNELVRGPGVTSQETIDYG